MNLIPLGFSMHSGINISRILKPAVKLYSQSKLTPIIREGKDIWRIKVRQEGWGQKQWDTFAWS